MARHAEVAGVGFAGLTLACGLARRGWSVRVHEAASELRDHGAGIFLWENGLQALRELGLEGRVLARSHAAEAWEERDGDGRELSVRPFPLPGGVRMITLVRRVLHAALLDGARAAGVEIRAGSRVRAADPEGALVTADGRRWEADLAVGADGIGSRVRDGLGLLAERRRFSEWEIVRYLVPLDRAPGAAGRWRNYVDYFDLAARRRALYVPCNADDLYLLLGAFAGDTEATRRPVDAGVWRASFPALAPVLADVPADAHTDRYELVRVHRWSAGRVALVGDAAHAMPPTIGQGAGTAMLNALGLAAALDASANVEAALRGWEATERPATDETQDTSVQRLRALFPAAGRRRDAWGEPALRAARREL